MEIFIAFLIGGMTASGEAVGAEVIKEPEEGYIIRGNRRSLEEIEKVYREMPSLAYSPPAGRWKHLPRTRQRIAGGESLRVVMLGDSIINDLSRSCWDLVLEKRVAGLEIEKITSVRGSTGCWWYRKGLRVETFVLDWDPDLVIIGGISHREDIESIRQVVGRIQRSSKAEVLLMTGAFGTIDPNDDEAWQRIVERDADDYGMRLKALAAELEVGFLDLRKPWAKYIRSSEASVDDFHRDAVHANPKGEQVIGRILARFLNPSEVR